MKPPMIPTKKNTSPRCRGSVPNIWVLVRTKIKSHAKGEKKKEKGEGLKKGKNMRGTGIGLDKICLAKFEQNRYPEERSNSASKMGWS